MGLPSENSLRLGEIAQVGSSWAEWLGTQPQLCASPTNLGLDAEAGSGNDSSVQPLDALHLDQS